MKSGLMRWIKRGGLLVLLLAGLATPAQAILKDFGPVVESHGFPLWYRDFSRNVLTFTQGLPLEICLSQTQNANGYLCNLLPEPATQDAPTDPPVGSIFNPANPIVFPTHFPSEAFWWSADALIAEAGYDAGLTLGLEAAFGADQGPAENDQVSFGRVRIRVDIPQSGSYRVTHPYGVHTFHNLVRNPANPGREINFTGDIGIGNPGEFAGALRSAIGPFLIWDADFPVVAGEELFIGDPNINHTVTGSPFGTNFFRIERLDVNGNALETVETDLFSLTGKIYTIPIPGPLTITRSTYSRNATGTQVDVFANSSAVSNADTPSSLEVKVPFLAAIPMRTADNEKHVAHLAADPAAVPATVRVINVTDVPPTGRTSAVTDLVTITQASYDPATQVLTITAVSSDELVPPVLTTAYGDLDAAGLLAVPAIAIAPQSVEVVSSAGGRDTAEVAIVVSPGAVDGGLGGFSPNGGETLVSGTVFTATWPVVAGAANYRLFYSTDNGATWQLVRVVTGATSYDWTVPNVAVPAPQSLLRVVARAADGTNLGGSRSAGVFTITPAGP